MTDEDFQDYVNQAVLSGDPQLAQLALEVVEEELGEAAAETVAQGVYDLYAAQHGSQVAASYVAAFGYTVEDPDNGELVVAVDEDGDLVISEEDAAALEAALGRPLEADDLAGYVAAGQDGIEEDDPRTAELEQRLTAAEQRLLEQQPQPAYEYEPTEQEHVQQQADRIEEVVDELELGINRQLSDRELTEVATALLNNSEAQLDKVHLHDMDKHHQRTQWMAERLQDMNAAQDVEQAQQADATDYDDGLVTDHDALTEHQRRAVRVSEMGTALMAGAEYDE
jgi:hypothetical protein